MGLLFRLLSSLSVSHLWNNKYLRLISKCFPRSHFAVIGLLLILSVIYLVFFLSPLQDSSKKDRVFLKAFFGHMKRNFLTDSVLCTLTIPIMECQLCCLERPDTCNNMRIHWNMKQFYSPGFVVSWSQELRVYLHPSPHITLYSRKMHLIAHFVARFMTIIAQIRN